MVFLKKATPAQVLQKILMDNWTLSADDKDMIVMYHKLVTNLMVRNIKLMLQWLLKAKIKLIRQWQKQLDYQWHMATLAILNEKITTPGVQIPIHKEVYEPILAELQEFGIKFHEKEVPYLGYTP